MLYESMSDYELDRNSFVIKVYCALFVLIACTIAFYLMFHNQYFQRENSIRNPQVAPQNEDPIRA